MEGLISEDRMMSSVFERKVKRVTVGAIYVKSEWSLRYNDELYQT